MRKFLLMSSALVVSGLLSGVAEAACIQTPTCSSLGYTSSSSCEGGIKCPFGNAWNCTASDLNDKIEELEKIIEDTEQGSTNCNIGDIYFSDKTCSSTNVNGKTPIGVVIYKTSDGHGQVLALNPMGTFSWAFAGTDLPELTNRESITDARNDFESCQNTRIILKYADLKTSIGLDYGSINLEDVDFPAARAVNAYATKGTKRGDWCLPALGVLYSLYKNIETVDSVLKHLGGTTIPTEDNILLWSSTESNYYSRNNYAYPNENSVWYALFNHFQNKYAYQDSYRGKGGGTEVLVWPVLEF